MLPRPTLRCILDDSAASEAALVRAMIAGERRAWREFHRRYDRLLQRCIARATARFSARVSADDAAEIYATVLVQLCASDMAKLRSFDPARGNRFSSWLGLIAIHGAVDHLRALKSEPQRAPIEEAEEVSADAPTPDQALEQKQALALVSSAIDALPDKDRELLTLYFDEGLDVEQIAARMQISVKTVYSKKHKIQTRLEARLAA
jgi:RNA polymerase sigma-70 factor (ECF subfamily)